MSFLDSVKSAVNKVTSSIKSIGEVDPIATTSTSSASSGTDWFSWISTAKSKLDPLITKAGNTWSELEESYENFKTSFGVEEEETTTGFQVGEYNIDGSMIAIGLGVIAVIFIALKK